jgi:hypothetical protein
VLGKLFRLVGAQQKVKREQNCCAHKKTGAASDLPRLLQGLASAAYAYFPAIPSAMGAAMGTLKSSCW